MSSADVAAPRRRALAISPWLRLARISNTPTVVTDVVAGAVLADVSARASTIAVVAVAAALFYTAGMIANDVFDLEVDRGSRPERPLPSGLVSVRAAIARDGHPVRDRRGPSARRRPWAPAWPGSA